MLLKELKQIKMSIENERYILMGDFIIILIKT
jgi:hypothetical protein